MPTITNTSVKTAHGIISSVLSIIRNMGTSYHGEGFYEISWNKETKETVIKFLDIGGYPLIVKMHSDMAPVYQLHEEMDSIDLVYINYSNVKLDSITLDGKAIDLNEVEMLKLTEFFDELMAGSDIGEERVPNTMTVTDSYALIQIDNSYIAP